MENNSLTPPLKMATTSQIFMELTDRLTAVSSDLHPATDSWKHLQRASLSILVEEYKLRECNEAHGVEDAFSNVYPPPEYGTPEADENEWAKERAESFYNSYASPATPPPTPVMHS